MNPPATRMLACSRSSTAGITAPMNRSPTHSIIGKLPAGNIRSALQIVNASFEVLYQLNLIVAVKVGIVTGWQDPFRLARSFGVRMCLYILGKERPGRY